MGARGTDFPLPKHFHGELSDLMGATRGGGCGASMTPPRKVSRGDLGRGASHPSIGSSYVAVGSFCEGGRAFPTTRHTIPCGGRTSSQRSWTSIGAGSGTRSSTPKTGSPARQPKRKSADSPDHYKRVYARRPESPKTPTLIIALGRTDVSKR